MRKALVKIVAALTAAVLIAAGCGSDSSQEEISAASETIAPTESGEMLSSVSGSEPVASEIPTESGASESGSSDSEAQDILFSADSTQSTPDAAGSYGDEADSNASSDIPVSLTEEEIPEHVTGIKDFSIIVGQDPDVMAGISWDDQIGAVVCDPTQVDWEKEGNQDLTYVIAAADKTIVRETITVSVLPDLDYHIFGMEGTAMVTEGSEFDAMDGVTWDDTIASVTADTSQLDTSKRGEYPISYMLTSEDRQVQVTTRRVTVVSRDENAWSNNSSADEYATVTDLGLWRLTAYMDTPADQGPYVGKTASGAPLVAGETVAVSAATCERLGLHFGDKLLIDGHVYTLEDHGGSAMNDQLWVDIFVNNEADEYSEQFNRYSEVYLLR